MEKIKEKLFNLIEKSYNNPLLSHVYSMEIDRLLRKEYGVKYGVTLSAVNFFSGGLFPNDLINELNENLIRREIKEEKSNFSILAAESLIKDSDVKYVSTRLYREIASRELNAINLFYANHVVKLEKVKLYFINKYLQAFSQELYLKNNSESKLFFRLNFENKYESVDGPLVTVLIPVFNASKTLDIAVGSILKQSWNNIQVILIDDASTDDSYQKMKELEKSDKRIEVLRLKQNLGPYACRNYGAMHARGAYITVHDADDIAFPNRIHLQVDAIESQHADCSLGYMLRINENGVVTRPSAVGSMSLDGYLRKCFVSLMLKTNVFRKKIGAWDYVRVGADAEILDRISALKLHTVIIEKPLMLALDQEGSLTNSVDYGLLNNVRSEYVRSYEKWHKSASINSLNILSSDRFFDAPDSICLDKGALEPILKSRRKDIDIINSSDFFDEDWYRSKYGLMPDSEVTPAEHYLIYGRSMILDPGPKFSSKFYLNTRSTKQNPLLHFLKGRDPGPSLKSTLYAANLVFQDSDPVIGIELAENNLPDKHKYTVNILRANNSLRLNDYDSWLNYLNIYLDNFSVARLIQFDSNAGVFENLKCDVLSKIDAGPLISIIMPAWNAQKTLKTAVNSILNQTWSNIELLIIDDCSSDETWQIMQEIKQTDVRVKIFKNLKNVGPYVSKNIALTHASGDWVTGHDADDWAHPQRIENHINEIIKDGECEVSVGYMLRMQPNGYFDQITSLNGFTLDGVARIASISAMFKRSFLNEKLGFWDSVRFGADSEMIARAQKILGERFKVYPLIGMICLNWEGSLTNDPMHGVRTSSGLSDIRSFYKAAWMQKHKNSLNNEVYIEFPPRNGVFHDNPMHVVDYEDIRIALGYSNGV